MTELFDYNDEHKRRIEYHGSGIHWIDSETSAQVDGVDTVGYFRAEGIGHVTGRATGYLFDQTRVNACNATTIVACDNSKVRVTGNKTAVHAFDNATVIAAYGDAHIFVYGDNVKVITEPTWTGTVTRGQPGAVHIDRREGVQLVIRKV